MEELKCSYCDRTIEENPCLVINNKTAELTVACQWCYIDMYESKLEALEKLEE